MISNYTMPLKYNVPMNVLMITGTYAPSANGVSVAVEGFSKELRMMGHTVTVCAPYYFGFSGKETNVIRYPSLPNPWIYDYPLPLFPLTDALDSHLEKNRPDIIHVHHPFHIGLSAQHLAKNLHVPVVFTYNTLYGEFIRIYLKFLPQKTHAYIEKKFIRDFIEKCNGIIVPSVVLKNTLQKTFCHIKMEHIPTGVSFGKKNVFGNKKILHIPRGKKIILNVSRLSPEKNTELLLKAFILLPEDFFLLIIGDGPQEKSLKQYADNHGIRARVRFLGKIPHDDLPQYYMSADIFTFTSVNETQGITLLEAAYFGIPVVAVDSPVSREWTYPDFRILTNNTADSLKNGIMQAVKLDKKKAVKTKTWARQFSMKSSAHKLIKLYKKTIYDFKEARIRR